MQGALLRFGLHRHWAWARIRKDGDTGYSGATRCWPHVMLPGRSGAGSASLQFTASVPPM